MKLLLWAEVKRSIQVRNDWAKVTSFICFQSDMILVCRFPWKFFVLYHNSIVKVPWKLCYLEFVNFKFEKSFHASHIIILTSVAMVMITQSGLYLRFECNFCFFTNVLFRALGDNLGLKRPASSCKVVAFAAGVQKKPKCCRGLKVVKGP